MQTFGVDEHRSQLFWCSTDQVFIPRRGSIWRISETGRKPPWELQYASTGYHHYRNI